MARILFTVCGLGLGHATRSSVLIRSLFKRHQVFIASYGSGDEYLGREFREEMARNGAKLHWFELVFKGSQYLKARTFFQSLPLLPRVAATNFQKMVQLVREFKPDLIISDFDVNGLYVGHLFGIPVVTISNMHLMNYVKPHLKFNQVLEYYLTETPVLNAFIASKYFVIPTLIKPDIREKNVFFFHPIVRESLLEKTPAQGSHILVYGSDEQIDPVLRLLPQFPQYQFIVYGRNTSRKEGNIKYKVFSQQGFAKDLLSAQALVCHGGTSILYETAVFQKPVCVVTKPDFFERYFNGLLAQGLGFGELFDRATKENLSSFFRNLDYYRQALESANIKPDNKAILKKLNEIIETEAGKQRYPFVLPETIKELRKRLVTNYALLLKSRHLTHLKTLFAAQKAF